MTPKPCPKANPGEARINAVLRALARSPDPIVAEWASILLRDCPDEKECTLRTGGRSGNARKTA